MFMRMCVCVCIADIRKSQLQKAKEATSSLEVRLREKTQAHDLANKVLQIQAGLLKENARIKRDCSDIEHMLNAEKARHSETVAKLNAIIYEVHEYGPLYAVYPLPQTPAPLVAAVEPAPQPIPSAILESAIAGIAFERNVLSERVNQLSAINAQMMQKNAQLNCELTSTNKRLQGMHASLKQAVKTMEADKRELKDALTIIGTG